MTSIKKNAFLNGINTVTSILYPVITFPYAARILLPEGIGAVNFLNSIINYIVLLTSLGIPLYAVKEVAKYRNDILLRNKTTVEILSLSALLCVCGYVIVWILATWVPQIHKQQALFYVLSLTILFTAVGATWFYQGIENFKFITIRALIVRTLAAASLFIFVKSPSDLIIYGMIVVGSTVGNNFINFIHLRKHIDFKEIKWRDLNITQHISPAFKVFILNLIISLYIQLNSIMLGFICGDEAVGYYTGGNKISHIGLMITSSLGTVLLPRCANLIQTGDTDGFKKVIHKSLNATLLLSFPITIGLIILSTPIIMLFCGPEFGQAIPVLCVTAPVVIAIGLTNLMSLQILYPKDKISLVIWSVSGGAAVNILLNFLIIPYYGALGAGISTLVTELTVLCLQLILGRQYIPFGIINLINWKAIISAGVMGVCVWITTYLFKNEIYQIAVGFIIGILSYSAMLLILKERLFSEMVTNLRNKIWHH